MLTLFRSAVPAFLFQCCLSLFLLFTLQSPLSYADSPPSPYRIGVVYGLTGAAQEWGNYGRMGLELARDDINRSGGVNGHPIELIIEDSQSNPAKAISAYRKLIAADKVRIVIGDVWDFLTIPLIPIASKDRTLLISPTVMDGELGSPAPSFFTMGHKRESVREPVERFFDLHPEVKTVAILCWDDSWGQSYLKLWRSVIDRRGLKLVEQSCETDFATDYRATVTRVAAKKPDAVIVAHLVDTVLQRMRELHFEAKVLGTGNITEFIYRHRQPAELFRGVYFTDWQPNADFIKKFEDRFHEFPIVEAHNHYDALRSIARALAINPEDPISGLRQVKYQGVEGLIDFTSNQAGNSGSGRLFRVNDEGQIELVK